MWYSPISIRIGIDEIFIKQFIMKPKTKQKRELKKEVFDELSSWDLGYSETLDLVDNIIFECGETISEILSNYFLSWDNLKTQRDEIISNLEKQYPEISKNELKKLIVQYLKDYWNSGMYKNEFGRKLSHSIQIEDNDY